MLLQNIAAGSTDGFSVKLKMHHNSSKGDQRGQVLTCTANLKALLSAEELVK